MFTSIQAFHQKHSGAVFWTLFLLVASVWSAGFQAGSFESRDGMDYAQMGRELREGKGFSTQQLFPRHVGYLQENGQLEAEQIPNLYRYPLPVMAHAAAQCLQPNLRLAAVLQSGLCFLLSIPMLYFLARRLGGAGIALFSTLAYLADPNFWIASRIGLTESLSIVLILASALLALPQYRFRGKALAMGAVCGLAMLTRTQLLFLFPVLLGLQCWAAEKPIRLRTAMGMALGFLVVMAPWLLRNYGLTGDPLFSFSSSRNLVLGASPARLDLEMQLHGPVAMPEVMQLYGSVIRAKLAANLWPALLNPLAWTGSVLYAALLGLMLLVRSWSPVPTNHYRLGVSLMVLCNFLVISLAFSKLRFFILLHPLILVGAMPACARILEALPLGGLIGKLRNGCLSSGLVLGLSLVGVQFIEHLGLPSGSPEQVREQAALRTLARITTEEGVIASDFSELISLHSGRRTLRLPEKPKELIELYEDYFTIPYVVLSSRVIQARGTGRPLRTYSKYAKFLETPAFQKIFESIAVLENGATVFGRRSATGQADH